jgi:multidrug efflux pump subunit AcrA (membrane-fusion protein)
MKKRMKKIKLMAIVLATLGLVGLIVSLTVGGSGHNEALAQESQTTTVQRGDLTVDINAAGNLALSHTKDLAVELFYGQSGASGTKGTIGEVLVQEGDSVKTGQVLVTLDPSEWDKQLTLVQKSLETAQRNVTTKEGLVTDAERQVTALQRQVTDKENAVVKAERQVTLKEFAVNQAEMTVQTANSTLNQITEVNNAKIAVAMAELNLQFVKKLTTGEIGGWAGDLGDLTVLTSQAKDDLNAALEDYNNIVAGSTSNLTVLSNVQLWAAKSQLDVDQSHLEIAQAQLDIEKSQMAVVDAQTAVDDANSAVEDAQIAVDDAKYAVDSAQQALENAKVDLTDAQATLADAQKDLDDTKSLSPEIKAPFDGFITAVNIKGGDEVLNGTIAVTVADPDKFEADILVSEKDISQIKLGGNATAQIDTMPGVTLPAKVTHIAPTATIQSGVVNYKVTVEVQSTPSSEVQPSVATENATMAPTAGIQEATGQGAIIATDEYQLREGLTVTLSLIVAERQNVLLVPYAAITKEGNQSYVQVVSSTGTIEKRAIKTGITNYQFTEVTGGLTEGEKVTITKSTTKTTTTTQQQQPGGIMIPGVGGGPPPSGG